MAADPPIWVGVDVGTQSVRAVAVSDDGHVRAEGSSPLTSRRDGVRHEQDPADWIAAAWNALLEMTSSLDRPSLIGAVAVSATSGTIVVVDPLGRPLSEGIMYDDARGAAYVDEVNQKGDAVWSRLGYRMQASWALPTMLWLARNNILSTGSRVITQADYITAALAGRPVASDSSHTLKAGLDLDTLEWPRAIIAELGFPLRALPDVVESGAVIGTVGAKAAVETGLPPGCKIIAGMTDGCAAQIAAGALNPGDWNSVLGTTLVIKGASTHRQPDPTGAVYSHRAPFGTGWFPGGASSTGAGSVSSWFTGQELAALTTAAAASGRITASYPLLGVGERFPFVAPAAHAFFDRRDVRPANPAELFADTAFGVAWVERLSYDLLDLCGYTLGGDLTFTGGGARNVWWNQLRCDVLRRPVRVAVAGEGAIGMAVLAAAGCAEPAPANRLAGAAKRMLRGTTPLIPDVASWTCLLPVYLDFLHELHRRGWLADPLHDHAWKRATA